MSLQVKIVNGSYRNQLMEGIFPLVRPWKDGANGGFVTVRVDNVPLGHNPVQRVKCEAHNCIIMDANGEELPAPSVLALPQTIETPLSKEENVKRMEELRKQLEL